MQSIGVHSPKVTMLSWARQIGASEELRMAQGHHRQSGAKFNVALYGRDDVHPAIQLQYSIIRRITSGFRPVIPRLRGGAKPVTDRSVSIPAGIDHGPQPDETPICLPDTGDFLDTDSDDSEVDPQVEQTGDTTIPLVQMRSSDCIFLLNPDPQSIQFLDRCKKP